MRAPLASLLCLFAACGSTPTEVVVCVNIDDASAARATSLRLVVTDGEGAEVYDREVALAELSLPASLPVRARGDDPSRRFAVMAELSDTSGVFQRASAEGEFTADGLGAIQIYFEAACADVLCDGASACRGGACGAPFGGVTRVAERDLATACSEQPSMDAGIGDADADAPDVSTDAPDVSTDADAPDAPDVPDVGPTDADAGDCGPGTHWSCADPLVSIEGGEDHSCALTESGRVVCWGRDTEGQLGPRASGATAAGPEYVVGITGATALSVGHDHTCVLIAGRPWCWGDNDRYQLGYASSLCDTSCDPSEVSVSGSFVAISAGEVATCALRDDGTATCWGDDFWGQLGNGGACGGRTSPQEVAATGISQVSERTTHGCALTSGEVRCWGYNQNYNLGIPRVQSCPARTSFVEPGPVLKSDAPTADEVTTGDSHTCVRQGGNVHCWGENDQAQLGISAATPFSIAAVASAGISDAAALSAGRDHTCALTTRGRISCWGYGSDGQVGNGFAQRTSTAFMVMTIDDATAVGVGDLHSCAITASRGAVCWGSNSHRQLGATSADAAIPVEVEAPTIP